MSKFYSLFSSSKGNASFLGDPQGGILIDAGVSCRKLKNALKNHGIPDEAVKAICITHSHSDHIAGLRVFLAKHPVPVYATRQTLQEIAGTMALSEEAQLREIIPGKTVHMAEIAVTAFPTMHDAPGSCGYGFVMPDGETCAVCTDLGCVTPEVQAALFGADLVLLEANYDPEMLRYGSYPWALQERIRGTFGHLSNQESAAFAASLITHGTTRLILGHLSENNNTMPLAGKTVEQYLRGQGICRNRDYLMEVSAPAGLQQAVIF